MSQIGEAVAIEAFSESGKTCPMEPHKKKKTLTGKAIEVKSVKDLRKAMKKGMSTRQWKQNGDDFVEAKHFDAEKKTPPKYDKKPIEIAGKKYPLSIAAHHLIPGLDSLPKSSLKDYIWKSEGVIDGDIGYDVDGAENGKWLATHQIMSSKLGKKQDIVIEDDSNPTRTVGLSWAELSKKAQEREENSEKYNDLFAQRYSQQAMALLNSQFHDSHANYSEWVKDKLDNISYAIETFSGMCEECNKNKKKTPPYSLVYRLNMLSKICDKFLSGPPRNSWRNIYTSRLSRLYILKPIPADKLK